MIVNKANPINPNTAPTTMNIMHTCMHYCTANLEICAQRTATRDYIFFSEAKQRILARDQEEKEVFLKLYDISELQNMKWINLILDTSFDSPENLALKILKASRAR